MHVGSETKVMSRTPPESDTPVFPGFLHTTRGSLQKREAGQYVNTDVCNGCSVKPEIELIEMNFVFCVIASGSVDSIWCPFFPKVPLVKE